MKKGEADELKSTSVYITLLNTQGWAWGRGCNWMMVQARVQCLVRVRGNEQGCVLNVSLTVESKKKRKEEMLQKCTFGCSCSWSNTVKFLLGCSVLPVEKSWCNVQMAALTQQCKSSHYLLCQWKVGWGFNSPQNISGVHSILQNNWNWWKMFNRCTSCIIQVRGTSFQINLVVLLRFKTKSPSASVV